MPSKKIDTCAKAERGQADRAGTTDATPNANTQAKANANTPCPAAWADRPALTRPWMAEWAEHAAHTGSVDEACRATGVSVAQVVQARRLDPAFDEVARVFEQVVDVRITNAVCRDALGGDAKSQALYFGKVRGVFLKPEPKRDEADQQLAPDEAEAAIRAVLEVREARRKAEAEPSRANPDVAPPAPSPSRPGLDSSRDSGEGEGET